MPKNITAVNIHKLREGEILLLKKDFIMNGNSSNEYAILRGSRASINHIVPEVSSNHRYSLIWEDVQTTPSKKTEQGHSHSMNNAYLIKYFVTCAHLQDTLDNPANSKPTRLELLVL